jgi:hypothetical protein
MVYQAGRHTAPFHVESSKCARQELAHLVGLLALIVL